MYVHVPGRIDRRRISQLASRSRDQLFLRAAGNLCKVYVRAWLDRGADTSRGTPCESLTSAFRWAEEAQGDEESLSMLRGGSVALVIQVFIYKAERKIKSLCRFLSLHPQQQGVQIVTSA